MKAYSLDLRQKVLAAALRGDRSLREVAELFGVGKTFVDKLLGIHRAGEDLAPRPHGGGYPARLLPRHEKLLRAHLAEQAALSVSVSMVSRSLIRLGLGRKKKSDGERA